MSVDLVKEKLSGLIPALQPAEGEVSGPAWTVYYVDSKEWLNVARVLCNEPELLFDYLFCVTCVDLSQTPTGKTTLMMVYHLRSLQHRHEIVIKAKLDRNQPEIQSVSEIWRTAEFHEREAYEMFGVNFLNHPDLRLLILPDGWEGRNPMRKDFEDPVNMIRL